MGDDSNLFKNICHATIQVQHGNDAAYYCEVNTKPVSFNFSISIFSWSSVSLSDSRAFFQWSRRRSPTFLIVNQKDIAIMNVIQYYSSWWHFPCSKTRKIKGNKFYQEMKLTSLHNGLGSQLRRRPCGLESFLWLFWRLVSGKTTAFPSLPHHLNQIHPIFFHYS